MRHANDDFADAGGATLLDQVVHHRDQALATLERETFLTNVTRMQIAFDPFSRRELLEQPQPLLGYEVIASHALFESLAQPQALPGPRYVRDLDSDLAAVNGLEQFENVAQFHALFRCARQATRKKLGIHVGLIQAEIIEFEHARHTPLHQSQRVDVRDLVPAQAVDLDQARYSRLFLA